MIAAQNGPQFFLPELLNYTIIGFSFCQENNASRQDYFLLNENGIRFNKRIYETSFSFFIPADRGAC